MREREKNEQQLANHGPCFSYEDDEGWIWWQYYHFAIINLLIAHWQWIEGGRGHKRLFRSVFRRQFNVDPFQTRRMSHLIKCSYSLLPFCRKLNSNWFSTLCCRPFQRKSPNCPFYSLQRPLFSLICELLLRLLIVTAKNDSLDGHVQLESPLLDCQSLVGWWMNGPTEKAPFSLKSWFTSLLFSQLRSHLTFQLNWAAS